MLGTCDVEYSVAGGGAAFFKNVICKELSNMQTKGLKPQKRMRQNENFKLAKAIPGIQNSSSNRRRPETTQQTELDIVLSSARRVSISK